MGVSDAMWAKYRGVINNFHNDANQQILIWKSTYSTRSRLGIEVKSDDVELRGLIQYNFFRNWPINKPTTGGEVDKESMVVLFNIEYLREQGFLNDQDQFNFDPGFDRFEVDGILYKAMGDSKTAQAKDRAILCFVILQREEVQTGHSIK